MTATILVYAFIGGLLPALIWLYYLLKEDARHPEPRSLIALAFVVGMLTVLLVLPFQHYAKDNLQDTYSLIVAWSLIEETLKYAVAALCILWRRAVDEAPDYVIYMITVALGFAAAENMLFLIAPLIGGDLLATFLTGNLRFLGANLLHVVASAAIGFAFAFSARSHPIIRTSAAALGLILAVALHALFNLLIMGAGGTSLLLAFFFVWIIALVFLAAFEVLKYLQSPNTTSTL